MSKSNWFAAMKDNFNMIFFRFFFRIVNIIRGLAQIVEKPNIRLTSVDAALGVSLGDLAV